MTEEILNDNINEEVASAENGEQVEMPDIKVLDLVFYTVSMLVEQAWVKMGLRANPATNTITKDLDEARLAIDSVAALVGVIESKVEPQMQTELKNLTANLQMNFVNQSAKE